MYGKSLPAPRPCQPYPRCLPVKIFKAIHTLSVQQHAFAKDILILSIDPSILIDKYTTCSAKEIWEYYSLEFCVKIYPFCPSNNLQSIDSKKWTHLIRKYFVKEKNVVNWILVMDLRIWIVFIIITYSRLVIVK